VLPAGFWDQAAEEAQTAQLATVPVTVRRIPPAGASTTPR
jgi:hypothetical protein